jgi:hypothetical protein
VSYNIDHVETNVLKASMRAGDIVDLYEEFEGELAEGNFLEEHLSTAERLCRDGIEDEHVKLENLWWYGAGSGRSYDVFLKHLAPKIKGEVEAVFTWEGGDSHSGLIIEDGVVTECDVELRVIRPKAKAKRKKAA